MNRNQSNVGLSLLLMMTWCCTAGCTGSTDADRAAAEWVLSTGGQVGIDVGGRQLLVNTGERLPSSLFTVQSIAWDVYPGDRNRQVNDAELHRLSGLSGLKQLDLWASDITDQGLKTLQSLSTLERLQVSQTQISDAGLEQLQAMPNLREIGLVGTRVTAAGIRRFQRNRSDCRLIVNAVAPGR